MLQGTGVGLRGIMFTGMGVDDATVYCGELCGGLWACGELCSQVWESMMLQGTGVGLRGIMFTGMGVDDATGYGCGPAGNYVHRYGSR